MNKRLLAIIAALGATLIYAVTHTIAKGVMPNYVQPYGFILIRVLGAAFLFWCVSFFGPKETIDKKDYSRILICGILGMCLNMISLFKGLSLSTPINSAVLITTIPIVVLILSAVLLKEKIGRRKIVGISIGLLGAVGLIALGKELRQDAPNIPLGNFLILLNSVFYGFYLVLVKRLISTYHPLTFMKWLFTIGVLACAPFGYSEVLQISWATLPPTIIGSIIFIVIGTTFCTYLFNIFALSQLKASTLSAFVYIQPLLGIAFAIAMGQDSLTLVKVLTGCLIIIGVYLASTNTPQKKLQ